MAPAILVKMAPSILVKMAPSILVKMAPSILAKFVLQDSGLYSHATPMPPQQFSEPSLSFTTNPTMTPAHAITTLQGETSLSTTYWPESTYHRDDEVDGPRAGIQNRILNPEFKIGF